METIKKNDPIIGLNSRIEECCILGADGINNSSNKLIIGDDAFIRSHTNIYNGSTIGNKFVTGNRVNVRENCKIGSNVSIGTGSVLEHEVTIGNNVRLHSLCFVCELTVLNDNCWIGPRVTFLNAKFPNNINTKSSLEGVIVEEGAIIGAGSILLPGVKIGKNAFIGAGAVVTKNVRSNSLVYGNPAKSK